MFSQRRVGLSKTSTGPSLLSNFRKSNSNPRPERESRPVDAPPESSSEDEADEERENGGRDGSPSSDDGRPGRGNITSTKFSSQSRGHLERNAHSIGNRKPRSTGRLQDAKRASQDRRKRGSPSDDEEDELADPPRHSKKQKTAGKEQSSLGNHLDSDPFSSQGKGGRAGYGTKKYSSSQSSQGRRDPSSQSRRDEPRAKFLAPRAATPDDDSPKKKFIAHDEVRRRRLEPSPSPVKTFKMPTVDETLSSDDSPKIRAPRRSQNGPKIRAPRKRALQTRAKQPNGFKSSDLDDLDAGVSQKAVFFMPTDLDGLSVEHTALDADESLDELGGVEKDGEEGIDADTALSTARTTPKPVCPMCGDPVDGVLLKQYARHGRMNIDQQMRFCTLHRKKSAREAWVTKGYPDIDWTTLDLRISGHYTFLKAVLEGESSYFRDALDDKVRQGKGRTLKKSDDKMTPGYYGPRGLRVMSESIIKDFSSLLRKRAVEDRLVSARGYASYVQTVMVPELAVHLIMEDMDVDREEARNIMFDSGTIGELVNEDIADVVLKDRGSDSEESSVLSDVESDDGFPEI